MKTENALIGCIPTGQQCMKNKNKEIKISFWASHFTTIMTVTLVLILGGIISIVWLSAHNETRRLKEKLELNVIMTDSITDEQGRMLADEIQRQPYAGAVRFISRDEALKEWTSDTGEDLKELFGVNPFSPEVSFTLKSAYSSKSDIARIKKSLENVGGVESVSSPDDEMVDAMNANLTRLTVVLGVVAAIMMLIAFVLINNTVHLSIYARRFTIHTMQLVGATGGFIRRPIVSGNMMCGLLAGLLAFGLCALSIWGARQSGITDVTEYLPWGAFGLVCAGMVVAGVLICGISSWLSATHYLHKDYDDLFR